ncbi:MAG: hypothetical protein Alis3KO_00900 [Aliiglaciecola sp.]
MSTAQYGSLRFQQAITFFRGKLNLPSERWTDVWQAQNNAAFHVAGAVKTELVADLREMVDSAIAQGKTLSWFKSQFKQAVKRHGWEHTGSAAWRANIIYSTNMRQAYNAGRYQQLQTFEFWRYKHGDSLSPRPLHLAKDGTILPKDSPFWRVWFPQNGWGCKCKVFGESRRSLARKGLKVSDEPTIAMREWTDKRTGEVHQIPNGIDPGFDYSPGEIDTASIIKRQQSQKPPLAQRLPKRVMPSAYSTVKGMDVFSMNALLEKLKATDVAPQIEALGRFLQTKNIKTVIIKSSEMAVGKASMAIAEDISGYLGLPIHRVRGVYTDRKKHKPEGFTHRSFDHVVIKASTKHNLSKVDEQKMLKGIRAILADGLNETGKYDFNGSKRWYASAQAMDESMSDSASRFVTWVHEIGHQVHYKAGLPAPPTTRYVTQYGNTNELEWFAEHFTFYLLAREQMNEQWPEVVSWFDEIMEQVTQ